MESKALKLRLTLHETQALEFRHRIHGMELDHHKNEAFSLGTVADSHVIILSYLIISYQISSHLIIFYNILSYQKCVLFPFPMIIEHVFLIY